jgi:hypothetical protein
LGGAAWPSSKLKVVTPRVRRGIGSAIPPGADGRTGFWPAPAKGTESSLRAVHAPPLLSPQVIPILTAVQVPPHAGRWSPVSPHPRGSHVLLSDNTTGSKMLPTPYSGVRVFGQAQGGQTCIHRPPADREFYTGCLETRQTSKGAQAHGSCKQAGHTGPWTSWSPVFTF